MLNSLITSKTRVRLLLKFFLNCKVKSYLRNLETEFGESSNAIRIELNRMEDAGLLKSSISGNKKMFQANTVHPLYDDINNIVKKNVGIDKIIEKVTSQVGDLRLAYITGKLAAGLDCRVIDLILVGENLDRNYITVLVAKVEELVKRKIRFVIFTENEIKEHLEDIPHLLIWGKTTNRNQPNKH